MVSMTRGTSSYLGITHYCSSLNQQTSLVTAYGVPRLKARHDPHKKNLISPLSIWAWLQPIITTFGQLDDIQTKLISLSLEILPTRLRFLGRTCATHLSLPSLQKYFLTGPRFILLVRSFPRTSKSEHRGIFAFRGLSLSRYFVDEAHQNLSSL